MKALTIWQPWASLIILGAKPYEFRGWRPPKAIIGERIVIHAAARKIDQREVDQLIRLLDAGGRYAARTCLYVETAKAILRGAHGPFPLAAGLGTAVIATPVIGTEVAEKFGVPKVNDSDRDAHANWAWPMQCVDRWEATFPMKGAQGLWNWPDASEWAK